MFVEKYLPAIEERGHYHQYYDPNHDNGDYGEKYFDMYLEIEPQSINGLCDKAMSLSNKNKLTEEDIRTSELKVEIKIMMHILKKKSLELAMKKLEWVKLSF